jgi:monofunctional glycosyltransferase
VKLVGRMLALLVISLLALEIFFAGRIALMAVVAPQSTTFQRSEIWRLVTERGELAWRQEWVDNERISNNLKRAVIASEDAAFTEHGGVDWDALEKAWEKNQRAEARAEKQAQRDEKRRANRPAAVATTPKRPEPRIVGGSTITQQLAKNLFLAGERNLARKGQEIVVTFMLEALLSKQRILEIYLNNVEWGEGVFGAEAAAQHYFRTSATNLGTYPSARLAVMLPAPKRFEKRPGSGYVLSRAATIQARMGSVDLP